MKRIVAFLLVCFMMIAVVACGGEEAAPTTKPSADAGVTDAPSADPTEAPDEDPTEAPDEDPTQEPTEDPDVDATEEPDVDPTQEPDENWGEEEVVDISDSKIIGLTFDSNGVVSNGVADGPEIVTHSGTIATAQDATIGMWASQMTGGDCFYKAQIGDYYADLEVEFTVEWYLNLSAAPASSYWSIGDNLEAGGFGGELHPGPDANSATVKFHLKMDGAYQIVDVVVPLNTWAHLVFTWDGNVLAGYLNGELVVEYESEWAYVVWPSNETAQHFCIGACCSAGFTGGQGMKGQIAVFNMYTACMNATTVADTYAKLAQ